MDISISSEEFTSLERHVQLLRSKFKTANDKDFWLSINYISLIHLSGVFPVSSIEAMAGLIAKSHTVIPDIAH